MIVRNFAAMAVIAAVMAAGGASAQQRAVDGALAYRARIALPEGALAVVEARDATGALVAELREATAGRQVPIPFSIDLPTEGDIVLRAVLLDGGLPLWLSEPLTVAASEGPETVGEIVLGPVPESGTAQLFRCGEEELLLSLHGEHAVLRARGRLIALAGVPAGSGARFEAPGDPATFFWSKGGEAMAAIGGDERKGCLAGVPQAEPTLRARGNEPGWNFEIAAGRALLVSDYGASRQEAGLPDPQFEGDAIVYRLAEPETVIRIGPGICHDDATGMPFGNTATVETGGGVLHGCAGEAIELLTGAEWVVEDIGGAGLIDSSRVTLGFAGPAGEGRVSGQGGCNRYNGGFTLTGEGLGFGPAAATMMACAEALMNQEQAFFAALADVVGFDIDETGALRLNAVDGRTLILARRG